MNKKHILTAKVFDRSGKLLAVANNNYEKTHPKQAEYAKKAGQPEKQYLHAEISAIIKSLKRGKPYSIEIERYMKNGSPALAAPCPICMIAIKESGIKKIGYTI